MRNEGQDCDYDKQKIKNYTESNRWVSNERGTKDNIVTSITFSVLFYLLFVVVTILSFVLCSVLSSVCRSHNIVLGKQKIKQYTESNRWVSNE
jgi:hypothetical protein